MIRHPAAELKCGTFAMKPVFHQNATLREQVERGVNRRPRDSVSTTIHVDVELVSAEMSVKFGDPIEHQEPFLGAPVLLSFEEIRKRSLERIDVLRWSHGHKYICA